LKSETKSLLVVSHVQHYLWEDKIWAFGAYAREIDIWADLFDTVTIASPCARMQPPGDNLPMTRSNISISPIDIKGGGDGLIKKMQVLISLPKVAFTLGTLMRKAWAIHLRLPGNLGAIGAVMAPFFSERIIAKYAGTWPDFSGEPLSYRIQKGILKSRLFKGPVTVYGNWPAQPDHIIPFFTSILSKDQIENAHQAALNRSLHHPPRILFVGRMDKGKNAHLLLDALHELKNSGFSFLARFIGDGAESEMLHRQSEDLDLENQVVFTGAIPFSHVLENYYWGDILVLASENSEGWPKAIAEAMAHGLVCFGSGRGLIPQMLADGRGIVIWPVTAQKLADALKSLFNNPSQYPAISAQAAAWSQAYSLDGLREAICHLLIETWHLPANTFDLRVE